MGDCTAFTGYLRQSVKHSIQEIQRIQHAVMLHVVGGWGRAGQGSLRSQGRNLSTQHSFNSGILKVITS